MWQNAEFPNVIAGDTYGYHGLQILKEVSIN